MRTFEKTIFIGNINLFVELNRTNDEHQCTLTFTEPNSKDAVIFYNMTYNDMLELYTSLLDDSAYSRELMEDLGRPNLEKTNYLIYRRLFNLSNDRTTYSFHVAKVNRITDIKMFSGVKDAVEHNLILKIEHDFIKFREIIRMFTEVILRLDMEGL